ncbi:Trafficking protein particle complex 8, partial [Thoreauomyces humboldtii]
ELTPWYTDYRNSICRFIGMSEHETFNHPIAYLVVVSTAGSDPVAAAKVLVTDIQPPPSPDKACIDPAIPKYYLLLHDPHLAPHVDPQAVLGQLKEVLGSVFLVTLNSVPHSGTPTEHLAPEAVPEPAVSEVWTTALAETSAMLEQLELSMRRTSLASVASGKDSIASPMTDEGFPIFKERPDRIDKHGLLGLGSSSRMDGPAEPQKPQYGAYLTSDDLQGLHIFAKQFATQKLIKHMETSVQQWNEQVASNRRGLTGRLNRLVGLKYFGGGAKAPGAAPVPVTNRQGVTIFPYNAPEMIMRRLADFAFMLRDYRLAFGTYDSVRKDFQGNEKFLKYHAGTQEMLGLTLTLMDGVGRGTVDSYLDAAVSGYHDTNVTLYLARAGMLHYEVLRERGMFREAAPLLIGMTGEDADLRSAMLLEQASMAFLQISNPMVRKYAFHLILAGHRFSKCGLRTHAYRCYVSALEVYSERDWALIEDHVHFTLGRQSFHLGEFEAAVRFFLRLLRASRQSQIQQSSYLREFLYLYKQYAAKSTEMELLALPQVPIPHINTSAVLVSLLETHSGQPKQVASSDEVWDQMETELFREGYAKAGSRALPGTISNRGKTSCAVGEPVFVTFEVENPMNVPIQINNVFLECSFGKADPPKSTLKWSADTRSPDRIEHPEFDLENVSEIALDDKERRKIQLRVFPKQEGEIKVIGVRFTLCGTVPSYCAFVTSTVPGSAASHAHMTLTVTSPMPLLDVIFHAFPSTMLSGQVTRVVLEINNKGNRGLRNLQLKTSHPTFFCIGENSALDATVYGTASDASITMQESFQAGNLIFNLGTSPIQLPAKTEGDPTEDPKTRILASGTTTLIPLWIRGDKVGKQNFRFLFGYQSETTRDDSNYRTLRYNMTTVVHPSLRINAFTRPSGRALDEFILGVEIENLYADGKLVLKQLSSVSPTWAIHPIEEDKGKRAEKACVLEAQQTVFKYFRFKRAVGRPEPSSSSSSSVASAEQIPEIATMRAIERLLLGEDSMRLNAPDLTLYVSSVALSDTSLVSCDTVPFRGLTANSRLQWRLTYLQNLYPGLTVNQLKDLFTFYFTDDVDLSMVWEVAAPIAKTATSTTPTPPTSGHQYVMGINLGMQAPLQALQAGLEPLAAAAKAAAGKALFETTVREKRALITSLLKSRGRDVGPVRVILRSDLQCVHDFEKESVCIVPITITVRNTSWASVADYSLRVIVAPSEDAVPSDTTAPAAEASTLSHDPGFTILGANFASGRLDPEKEASVTFRACFPQPGVYNVGRWRLDVNVEPVPAPEAVEAPRVMVVGSDGVAGKASKLAVVAAAARRDAVEGARASSYVQAPTVPHWITVLDKN